MRLALLYDADCRLCVPFARWVAQQELLVPMELVPCDSPAAHARFPGIDHAATRAEVTVLGGGAARSAGPGGGDYPGGCADACSPLRQG
ncbi:MAG TPA: hypothetical protein VGE77_03810 [Nocardioides sp.]